MESGGMYSSMGSGMLGLEMSLHHQIPPQQNPNHIQQQSQPSMVAFDHHHHHSQPAAKPGLYGYGGKPKAQGLTLSDEDEPATADQSSAEDGKRKMSPWQRMKWTDDMVKLLIMVVYYIGDEGGPDGGINDKKGGGHGVLQKKGKWKSVSRAMMERGFSVSPQQCEDKFNDLNKRYKRVNDILGKGTACRVVENQTLLESMDLSPKMKEEVKKLLNSKHLFFREMCAYHNSCSHVAAAAGEPPAPQQNCLHSRESARLQPNLPLKTPENEEGENKEDECDSEEEEDDDQDIEQSHYEEEEEEADQGLSRKRPKKTGSFTPMLQQLSTELTNLCQDSTRSPLEKRHWIRARMMQLDEQQIRVDSQKLELAKQRLKWEKYSSKKERDMEKEKLTNERKRLENDRMVLLLQQKELELLDHLHHQRTSDPSSVTG